MSDEGASLQDRLTAAESAARVVQRAVITMNDALANAHDLGVHVDLQVHATRELGNSYGRLIVTAENSWVLP